jgi:thymidylate kinase
MVIVGVATVIYVGVTMEVAMKETTARQMHPVSRQRQPDDVEPSHQRLSAVRRWLKPSWPWVAILGLDGSGKTTVLNELSATLSPVPFSRIDVIHRRPGIIYPLKDGTGSTIDHYGKPPHGQLISTVKLAILVLDWVLGYLSKAVQPRQGYLLLSDRHALLDLLVDPFRYRYAGSSGLVRFAMRFVPMPDIVLLLDAPVHILQDRKQELTAHEATRQREAYLGLVRELPNSSIVDAARPIERVVAEVKQLILARSAGLADP